jgi:hypothetical protein
VNLVKRSEMLAPYKIDSSVGSRTTWMLGLHEDGIYLAQKNVMAHIRTGVAGNTNWDVTGIKTAARYATGINALRRCESMM